jgi:hypothetical protein
MIAFLTPVWRGFAAGNDTQSIIASKEQSPVKNFRVGRLFHKEERGDVER